MFQRENWKIDGNALPNFHDNPSEKVYAKNKL